MMENFGPIILIEVVLVFGGVLLFAWWQLRDLRKEREKDQKKKDKDKDKDKIKSRSKNKILKE